MPNKGTMDFLTITRRVRADPGKEAGGAGNHEACGCAGIEEEADARLDDRIEGVSCILIAVVAAQGCTAVRLYLRKAVLLRDSEGF